MATQTEQGNQKARYEIKLISLEDELLMHTPCYYCPITAQKQAKKYIGKTYLFPDQKMHKVIKVQIMQRNNQELKKVASFE